MRPVTNQSRHHSLKEIDMGHCYDHLTEEDRITIRVLLQEGRSRSYIGGRLGRAKSTIKREIRRNRGLRGYRPKQAQERAEARARGARARKMTPEVIEHIEQKLREDYSPEQIAGTMGREIGTTISHERIYQHVYADKAAGGELYRHLRIVRVRKRRKRYGSRDKRGKIPGRVGIEQRPGVVDKRGRYGDWEADLVSGSHHRGFLVTVVERKSKYTLIGHVRHKQAEAVREEIVNMLRGHKVKSITYDNGHEFSHHQQINQALGCNSYFATPYHSWERGVNENTNGLIRQYFPKGMDLRDLSRQDIRSVQDRLNSRPRKTLDFNTPEKVWSRVS